MMSRLSQVLGVRTRLVKEALAASLYYTGIAWLCFYWRFRRQGVVLMYHRVLSAEQAPKTFSADAIIVSPRTFDRHMRFLRRYCNPVSADEFLKMLKGQQSWRPKTCLVTFDDGWADNAEHAYPILAKYQIPAVVFLATGYVGTEECFWQERLTRLLYFAWTTGEKALPIFTRLSASHILKLPHDLARQAIRHRVTALKLESMEDLAALERQVNQFLADHPSTETLENADRFMSWPEAKKLADSGLVTLGSHAHSHTPLTKLTDAQIQRELEQAESTIAAYVGCAPTVFAYPNGDYNNAIVDIVRKTSCLLAFTTNAGPVHPDDHPWTLKRMNISERGTTSSAGFLCRLLGWL